MDLRGHAIIFGLATLTSTSSLGVTLTHPNLFSKGDVQIEKASQEPDKRALDGYVEMGILEDEPEIIKKDCDETGNGTECKQILNWALDNGRCNIYFLNEEDREYNHWYLHNLPKGLVDEIYKNSKKYSVLCKDKKSINFHFDKESKKWEYDGYERHSWN